MHAVWLHSVSVCLVRIVSLQADFYPFVVVVVVVVFPSLTVVPHLVLP